MTPFSFIDARTALLGAGVSLALLSTGQAQAGGPFARFGGTWGGAGTIAMADGSREAIRCRAIYSISSAGESLGINVSCASDSTRIHIVSDVVDQGGRLSGTWQETTRQVGGDVEGRMPGPDQIQASLSGTGFGLGLGERTDGRRQAITLTTDGTDVKSVSIVLDRR